MLLRRVQSIKHCLPFSTVAEPKIVTPAADFRTVENNPKNQTIENSNKFYTIPEDVRKQIFHYGGFPKKYEKQIKTFTEACLMVRPPALEIINCINNTNFNKPTIRYVVYGKDGVGKSLTLAHLLHYGLQTDFLLVHVPWVPNWFKKPKETANSTTKEGFIDLPLDGAAWLMHFKSQNQKLLTKLDLRTTKDYVWSKRETTPANSTLTELVEHGINRVKYATDTIELLMNELKLHSSESKCKTMVVIDGYNAFFYPRTRILTDTKGKVKPAQVTLTAPFLNITNYDWNNGVCILAVDKIALTEDRMESELPRYLLGEEGFEHLDPFVPIRVENYTEQEYENCIKYYLDRKWIQNSVDEFDKELKFLSGKNPYKLMEICAPL